MGTKVGIVGCGFVGSTAAYAMVMDGVGREIIMVDLNPARAQAEADDIRHAVPFSHPLTIRGGTYQELTGSDVVIIAAGVNQKPGETRLHLLERNAEVFRSVVPAVLENAPEAVLLVATNPVDIMTHVAADIAREFQVPSHRVIGSGTTLDTARFRTLVGEQFGIDSRHVHGYVVGEHGDTEVLTWSLATIAGTHLDELASLRGIVLDESIRETIDRKVRRAAYSIISGKGATYYGIGAALARIVDVVIHDQRSVLTIASQFENWNGIGPVTFSLPQIVGGSGALGAIPLSLADNEVAALKTSVNSIREAIVSLG